ncbi:MAG: hypothetical protein GC154_12570 [bacterium]|nr:hypothetical protein [bacterium]
MPTGLLMDETMAGAPAMEMTRACQKPAFTGDAPSEDDMALINRLAASPLRADQVYVRAMLICSTQPCESDGCQFTPEALEQIASIIVGRSVLPGHNRQSLPLARFFKAEVTRAPEDGEAMFVRAWFYWLRGVSGARDLLLNVDGGIYREVSLAWKFNAWRCSICGQANGRCSHRPGEAYQGARCYRLIDRVTEVLEGSLVYKSADRGTNIVGARSAVLELEAPVLLIAREDDPAFARLRSHGLLSGERPLEEWGAGLEESAEAVWFRGAMGESLPSVVERALMEGGALLVDSPSGDDEQQNVAVWIREGGELRRASGCETVEAA